ncbi:MAG TPA: FG-GAP-like repeat-containing protein, partial [Conexibacter sp.]|nr:FG-GAP-like repeat-containing protein [Conexibacter sp.]
AIADLYLDGQRELGVACAGPGTPGVRILERDAAGTYAQIVSDSPACDAGLASVAAGNFDGDPYADLAVDCLTDRLDVLSSHAGFGPLRGPDNGINPVPWFTFPTGPSNPAFFKLQAQDVNSDGFDDVLVTDVGNSAAVVADGRANGQFYPDRSPASTRVGNRFPIAANLREVIAADVNEDGKRDLVAVAGSQIAIRLNTTPVPGLRSGSSSGVGPTAATLGGIVNPGGTENANSTTYRFEYGTTGAYGETTAALPSGASLAGDSYVSVSAQLDGLAPETGYHYRIVASNGHGTTYGSDRTFKTAATPPQGGGQQQTPDEPGPSVDRTAPELALSVAGSIKRGTFLKKGIRVSGNAGEESTLEFELVGRTKSLRLARVGDVVLAERSLPRAAGPQATTLRLPRSFRRSLSRRFTLTIRVTATDAAGNRTVKTSTLKVR